MQTPEKYEHVSKDYVTNPNELKVWAAFLDMVKKTISKDMKNVVHKIHEDVRHRIFTGNYFYYISFKSPKDIARLRKIVKSYAEIYTLEEHHRLLLEVYNKRILQQNNFF